MTVKVVSIAAVVLMTAKLGLELLICDQFIVRGGRYIDPRRSNHLALDGVILVVLCIILLPQANDTIQDLVSPRDRRYRDQSYSRSPYAFKEP
ncbi:hypothetical protein NC653_036246 [Populus alba x Populus x berolinensis]|uniref:Uncharacterized protein n=1 Tax=Populus alba x Populus x berolinensis TaxID=444605 RepID=A0AAD6LJR7_9ROSI|nr:hypothetical protein NC653_036246 [Populus alba x Populus x berolinensis]